MAGKEDIETPAETAPAPRADAVLEGLAGALAQKLKVTSETALAEPDGARDALKTAQIITGLARAAIALQQMQAQEDKALERLAKRAEDRAVAQVRARTPARLNPDPDEDDDTDMNDRDPRLDDPDAMAAARAELSRRLDALALEIKAAGSGRRSVERGVPGGAGQLADAEPPEPTPAPH